MRNASKDAKRYYQQGKQIHDTNIMGIFFTPACQILKGDGFPHNDHGLCYSSCDSLKDFKEFADAVESIKDNGVVVAVASPDDVEAANKEKLVFPEVKKCL